MKGKRLFALILTVLMVCTSFSVVCYAKEDDYSAENQDNSKSDSLHSWVNVSENRIEYEVSFKEPLLLPVGEKQSIPVNISADGSFCLVLEYKTVRPVVLKTTLLAELGGEGCRTKIESLWKDETKEYKTDRFGNEMPPEQVMADRTVTDYVIDQAAASRKAFEFSLKAGENLLELTSDDCEIELYRVLIVKSQESVSYSDYKNQHSGAEKGKGNIIIEAEDYILKSESYIRAGAQRNPALYPYNYSRRLLNVLESSSFNTVGQKVLYEFEAKNDGLYKISFRYNQNYKEDIPAYANIKIDSQ